MSKRWWIALCVLVLTLCVSLGAAVAEKDVDNGVKVLHVDENGRDIADPVVLTLEKGAYRITPLSSVLADPDYRLTGESEFIVTVDDGGVSQPEVTFTFEKLLRAYDVTVRYVDAEGNEIADPAVLTLEKGAYRITPAKGAVSEEAYVLTGESEYIVTVDENGAEPSDVAFTYEAVARAYDVTVRYVDDKGNEIADPAVLTLEKGAYRITPAKGAVSEKEYVLTGESEYIVTVDENGAEPSDVAFTYGRAIKPVSIIVHLVDENGSKIVGDTLITLTEKEACTRTITRSMALAPGVSLGGYEATGPDSYDVAIDADGASLSEITFTYQRIVRPAKVTVRYMDDSGNEIAEAAELTLEKGTYRITPGRDAVSAEDYTLIGDDAYTVTVDADGASIPEIIFTYQAVPKATPTPEPTPEPTPVPTPTPTPRPAQVTIRYTDENGKNVYGSSTKTLDAGDHTVTPALDAAASIDYQGYILTSDNEVTVTVDQSGAHPAEVIFTYRRIIADVTVRYIDETTGEALAEEKTMTLNKGEYSIEPSADIPADYTLTSDASYTVTVDENGASPSEVTFTYVPPMTVVVHYVDDKGAALAEDQEFTFPRGEYVITADAGISPDDYALIGDGAVTVGAGDTEVTFTYERVIHPADVTVWYVDENSEPITDPQTVTVKPGTYRITAAADAVPADEYEQTGIASYAVTVDENGASVSEVIFTYKKIIHTAEVTVQYVDDNGQEIAPPDVVTLHDGTFVIGPGEDAVSDQEYRLISEESYIVSVDKYGATLDEITFVYRKLIDSADVTVRYVDENGEDIAPPEVETLTQGTYTFTPTEGLVSPTKYELISDGAYSVTVDEFSASQTEVVFTYRLIDYQAMATGENLLADSGRTVYSEGGFILIPTADALRDYVGVPVTVSFEIKTNVERDLRCYPYQTSGISMESGLNVHVVPGDYQRVSFTTTVKDFGQVAGMTNGGIGIYDMSDVKASFSIRKVKIEMGYLATDWELTADDPLLTHENLLANSAQIVYSDGGFLQIPTADALRYYTGLPITVSFDIASNVERDLRCYAYQTSGISMDSGVNIHVRAGDYQRVSFTTTVKDYGQIAGMTNGGIAVYDMGDVKASFSIRKVKIEIGYEATAWSLGVNDVLTDGEVLLYTGDYGLRSQGGRLEISTGTNLVGYENMPIYVCFVAKADRAKDVKLYPASTGVGIGDDSWYWVEMETEYQFFEFTTTVQYYGAGTGAIVFVDSDAYYTDFDILYLKIQLDF